MSWTFLALFDLVGTIAFAISGALVGIKKGMDIFGVNVLAITTACGGGFIRDLIVNSTPPNMFQNPVYVGLAALVANLVFGSMYLKKASASPKGLLSAKMLFWMDTLGLAAFTVDGVIIGYQAGYTNQIFLPTFLGLMTGVGGGALRDIMANQMPDIFQKHIYAVSSLIGGLGMTILFRVYSQEVSMVCGFLIVICMRWLAAHFKWNLPHAPKEEKLSTP
ncbi:MAG: trimeric intracellular cation channel family protein [Clostridiales bacterium]|jgi:uncharacterized membrane protein YeiH|nr:trimeric intracellular cation channel family protein [Clostridiales bacterium]MCI2160296.1 trimeric intracellular cation channel family protein [Oscillospiraceae bacterium]MCI1961072.1 trimeric intracellular cation channel family protein [Clostridiales bacterium]MCI2021513.1 trimeric intracellular cation channel family protein [Clostridiales bacterium]MCI2026299.1 trimeric intracellular cation channel family protein [Clostridiales bacterium]